jgi:hypothetical protein
MADYYTVLARAISRLSDSNARKRHEIYERARAVVLEELSKLDPEKVAPEQAQLEAAIQRLEAEASARDAAAAPPPQRAPRPAADVAMAAASPPQAAPRPANVAMAAAPAPQAPPPAADVTPAPQRRPASGYIARVFGSMRRGKPPVQQTPPAPAPAQAPEGSAGRRPAANAPDELSGMLNSLRTMLFGTAFLVAVLAITGVVYVRGLIWVAAGAITYSGLLVVTAAAFILSLAVAVSIFRSASSLPGFGLLSRLIHSASRRVF